MTVDFLPLFELSWVFFPVYLGVFCPFLPLVEEALERENVQGYEDSWSNCTCSSVPTSSECHVRDTGRRRLSLFPGELGEEAGAEPLVVPCHCSLSPVPGG